jgi:hypothetical protein
VIILSGVLVVLAIALLVAGIVAGADGIGGIEGLTLIYISIGISIVSALCLAIGVFLRRKELFGTTGAVPSARAAKAPKPGKAARKAQKAREAREVGKARETEPGDSGENAVVGRPEPGTDTVAMPAQPHEVPADSAVWVVRGRKRYHLEHCRQLAGREKEELTYEEAVEEGFSECTACMPDTALAARAVTVSDTPEPAESAESAAEETPDSYDGPAAAEERSPYARPAGAEEPPARSPYARPEAAEGDPLSGGFESPGVQSSWEDSQEGGEAAVAPTIPAPAASKPEAAGPAPAGSPQVRILSGTKRYHRPDCALIEDIGDEADDLETLSREEAKARGCTPCLVCQPDRVPARDR